MPEETKKNTKKLMKGLIFHLSRFNYYLEITWLLSGRFFLIQIETTRLERSGKHHVRKLVPENKFDNEFLFSKIQYVASITTNRTTEVNIGNDKISRDEQIHFIAGYVQHKQLVEGYFDLCKYLLGRLSV